MQKAILGRKLGMTQLFNERGSVFAVTVVEAGPCIVVQKKEEKTDGYDSIQVGFDNLKPNRANRALKGHFQKTNTALKKKLKEFRLKDCSSYKTGDLIKADIFSEGERVDVTATSKGKGFSGTIKRFNAHLLKKSHGTGPVRRQAGSMSGASDPSRIFKGKKMAGRMGGKKVTVQNLELFKVDAKKNILVLKGAIPGPKGTYVQITNTVKVSKRLNSKANAAQTKKKEEK